MSNEVTISSNFHSLTGKITMSGHLRVNESYAVPCSIRSCGKSLLGRLGMIPGLSNSANMLLQNMMANGDVVVFCFGFWVW